MIKKLLPPKTQQNLPCYQWRESTFTGPIVTNLAFFPRKRLEHLFLGGGGGEFLLDDCMCFKLDFHVLEYADRFLEGERVEQVEDHLDLHVEQVHYGSG